MNQLIQASLTIFTKATAKSGSVRLLRLTYDRAHAKYGKFMPASFFALGIIFDVATMGRIDNWFILVEQGIFLFIIGFFLALELRLFFRTEQIPRGLRWLWVVREPVMHFLLGGLLSAFMIFYFKSSSGLSAFVFVALLSSVLVLNETPRFRNFGLTLRFLLFMLCLTSYLGYLVPILLGSIGALQFMLAVALSVLVLYFFLRVVARGVLHLGQQLKLLVLPGGAVQLSLVSFYFLGVLPPVPLSVQQIGIYHEIKKEAGVYQLQYTRPRWKFWQNGDQTFVARQGDQVHCFARIFSPTKFKGTIYNRWQYRNRFGDWQTTDRIPITIIGGREEGFRGYTVKKNYAPGKWRVRVETSDGRELGRIYFRVMTDASRQERVFRQDLS